MYLGIFDSYSFKLFFKSRKNFWDKLAWNSCRLAWSLHGSFASASKCCDYRLVSVPSLKINFWVLHSAIKLIIKVLNILLLWIMVGVVSAWIASMHHHTQQQSLKTPSFPCGFDCGASNQTRALAVAGNASVLQLHSVALFFKRRFVLF